MFSCGACGPVRGQENAEAGAIIRVPSGTAVRMILAATRCRCSPMIPALPSGTLVAAIRAALRSDAELYALLVGARAYAFTMPAGRMCGDGRRTPARDHRRFAASALPRLLQRRGIHEHVRRRPAGCWYAAPEALPFQTRDRKAELLAHHCRDWRYQLQKRPSAIG